MGSIILIIGGLMKIFLLSILFVCAFAQEDPRDPDWDNLVKVSPERGCLNLCSRWYGSSRRPGNLVVGKRSRCIIACTSSERIRYQKSAVCDRYCTEMCRGTGCRGKCHFRCRVPANTMRTRIISLRRNSDGNIRVEIPRGLRQGRIHLLTLFLCFVLFCFVLVLFLFCFILFSHSHLLQVYNQDGRLHLYLVLVPM